jgi:hypothetical protein
MPAKPRKWTAAQIKQQVQRIKQAVDKHRRENKEQNFTSVTPEEIAKKLKRVRSPMIVSQGWTSNTAPGGSINYSVGIFNPDPTQWIWLFVHVWIGSGNVDPTTGTFLSNVDSRFPRLTEPAFDGLVLAPGAFSTLSVALKVPSSVEKTNYLGNACLMQSTWHDVGVYLDRGVFVFGVV